MVLEPWMKRISVSLGEKSSARMTNLICVDNQRKTDPRQGVVGSECDVEFHRSLWWQEYMLHWSKARLKLEPVQFTS